MSHAARQVRWCLQKAKRELEECTKQGKQPKHRGLVETKPDIEAAKDHIGKAEHNFEGMLYNAKGGFTDLAMSTGFYAVYHCMLAILAAFGYESRNQTCTMAAIESLREQGKIDLDEKYIWMLKPDEGTAEFRIIDLREEYTYGMEIKAERTDLETLKAVCREVIYATKNIVYGRTGKKLP